MSSLGRHMPSLSPVQFKLSSYETQGRKWDVMKHKEVVLATAVLWCVSTSELCFGGGGGGGGKGEGEEAKLGQS